MLTAVGFPLPSTFSTSNQDSESGNESLEMDSSMRLNVSSASSKREEQGTWNLQSNNDSWKLKNDGNSWQNKNDSHWAALSGNEIQSQKWPTLENSGESFLKSLIRTPILNNEFPPPPPEPKAIQLVR